MTSGIIEILIENADVVSAVGMDDSHVKVYPVSVPQNVDQPYIVVREASLNPSLSKGCISDLDRPMYEVLAFSLDFHETELMQEACRNALDTGTDFITDAGATFDSIWMTDRRDVYMPAQGQEGGLYVKVGIYQCSVRRILT